MPTAKCKINAGVCGFVTEVTASTDDGQNVSFEITSDCENVRQMAVHLGQIDAFAELGAGFDGEIFTTARKHVKGCCSGCVVLPGIFKAMQVAAGLALPQTATVEVVKAQQGS